MARVNPPSMKAPVKLINDPELKGYFEGLDYFLYQLWQRTGGGEDLIESGNSSGESGDIDSETDYQLSGLLHSRPIVVLFDGYITESSGIFVTDGFDIKLNNMPADNEKAYIKTKKACFIDGNGRNVEGKSRIHTGRNNTCLLVNYIAETDEWLII